jgi:flagellar motility protein MotE (MotC chaperone)
MDPEESALRIEQMREGLALDILAGIKDKKAAGILAGVNPKKAARLSEGLQHYRETKLKRPVDSKAPK